MTPQRTLGPWTACAALLAATSVIADTIRVPDDYATIQAAIDAAIDGDEVVVADGIWTGAGNKDLDFGGRLITVRSASGDPESCVIDCEGAGRGFDFHGGETDAARVEGFTIANGRVGPDHGGGIRIVGASPVIERCRLVECQAQNGGGLYVEGGDATITDCAFLDNLSTSGDFRGGGGGMCVTGDGSPTITRCVFDDNTTDWGGYGAGMSVTEGSNPTVVGCRFTRNRTHWGGDCGGGKGGAVNSFDASPVFVSCLVHDNEAPGCQVLKGGGFSIYGGKVLLVNCTVSRNTHGGITGYATVVGCIVWDNEGGNASSGDFTFSCIDGGPAGEGNIGFDPQFVDPDGGDFRLAPGSPCIDAGDNDVLPQEIVEDLDGNPRYVDDLDVDDTGQGTAPLIDMGAYETQTASCPADLDDSRRIDFGDVLAILAAWGNAGGPEDLDGSGVVDLGDILVVLAQWGSCPGTTGACCFDDGTCADGMDLDDCLAFDGRYRGAHSTCEDHCLAGACCFEDGTCSRMIEKSCVPLGGTYQGDGTTCKDTCDG